MRTSPKAKLAPGPGPSSSILGLVFDGSHGAKKRQEIAASRGLMGVKIGDAPNVVIAQPLLFLSANFIIHEIKRVFAMAEAYAMPELMGDGGDLLGVVHRGNSAIVSRIY